METQLARKKVTNAGKHSKAQPDTARYGQVQSGAVRYNQEQPGTTRYRYPFRKGEIIKLASWK